MRALIFILLLIMAPLKGLTNPLPTALRDGSSRFLSRSLGLACYTLDSVQQGLPCNPAAIAKERAARFDSSLFLGTKQDYVKDAEDLLNDSQNRDAMAALVLRQESVEAEASLEASFQKPNWGFALEPYRLIAVSQIENSALPMVDLVIAEEKSLKLQVASYYQDDFYAGLQLRYSHLRFIGQYFSLSEAFTEEADKLFNPQNQDIVYIEPGVLYSWEELPWQPQISATLAHWGWSEKKTDPYTIQPTGILGASLSPRLPLGALQLGVQLSLNSQMESLREALRLAGAYQLGVLQAMASFSQGHQSAGFLVTYKSWNTGLSYWDEQNTRSVFIQLGIRL